MNDEHHGGALSGDQLYRFFYHMYNDKTELPEKFIPLNEDDLKLYNNKLKVFYNPENIHIVVVHRGTKLKSNRDVFNNVRNFIAVKNEYLITYRNLTAKEGHIELKNFLIKIYRYKGSIKYLRYKSITDYIDRLLKTFKNLTVSDAVDKLLKRKLSTIGYSQGAVYAYLYGEDGKETLVYNPAPFFEKKPENTYVVKIEKDPVSALNSSKKIYVLNKKTRTYKEAHSLKHLKNSKRMFGNPTLHTKYKKSKSRKNKQTKKNVTLKNKK